MATANTNKGTKSKGNKAAQFAYGEKSEKLIQMLSRKNGVTVEEAAKALKSKDTNIRSMIGRLRQYEDYDIQNVGEGRFKLH